MRLTPDSLAAAAQRAKEREAMFRDAPGCEVRGCGKPSAVACELHHAYFCWDHRGRGVNCCRPLAERRRP